MPSAEDRDWETLRAGVIGLGAHSTRKSYYPELRKRVDQLERFRTMLDDSNDAILLLELPEGDIVDANRTAAGLLGITEDGVKLGDVMDSDIVDRLLPALDAGHPIRFEACLGTENDPFEIDAHPVKVRDGRFAALVARDIRERRRAQEALRAHQHELEREVAARTEELRRANEELIAATRAKDLFLASMSHELRTPLNSIIGFSDLMLRELAGPISEEQARQLAMVNNAGKHLLGLINQVLDLAKIESGQADVALEPFDACELLAEVVDLVQGQAAEKGLGVTALPDLDECKIYSDRRRVLQVMLNLAGNAVKFTQQGGIRLSVTREDGSIVFRVSDTGPGIPPHALQDIWQPFRQLPEPDGIKPSGTGLGLSISKELATMLGGTLEVSSVVGTGTTFALRLPPDSPQRASGRTY